MKLWDFKPDGNYDCVKTLRGHDHNISKVAFLSSGGVVVSCSRDTTIKLWQVDTGYCIQTLKEHTDWIRDLDISYNGTLLASCGNDQSIRVWNVSTGKSILVLKEHDHVVECVKFSNTAVDDCISQKTFKASVG